MSTASDLCSPPLTSYLSGLTIEGAPNRLLEFQMPPRRPTAACSGGSSVRTRCRRRLRADRKGLRDAHGREISPGIVQFSATQHDRDAACRGGGEVWALRELRCCWDQHWKLAEGVRGPIPPQRSTQRKLRSGESNTPNGHRVIVCELNRKSHSY